MKGWLYRVEFTNPLNPKLRQPADPLGGGNELLWQLTGGTETMKVTRIEVMDATQPVAAREDVLGNLLRVLPNNHGPQTDRLVYGLGPFKGYNATEASSREIGLFDLAFVDSYIQPLSNGGRIIAGQFDDPYQLDEKGIFDLVNLNRTDLGGIQALAAPCTGGRCIHGFQCLFDCAGSSHRRTVPEWHPAQRYYGYQLHRQSASRMVEHQPQRDPGRRSL